MKKSDDSDHAPSAGGAKYAAIRAQEILHPSKKPVSTEPPRVKSDLFGSDRKKKNPKPGE